MLGRDRFISKNLCFEEILIIYCIFVRLKSHVNKLKKHAVGILGGAAQGRKRIYNTISEDKLKKMLELSFHERSEAKIRWAVKAFNDWRVMKLDTDVEEVDENILYVDLNYLSTLKKENFEYCLCRFMCEVRKSKGGGEYPGCTLYQMFCALQNFLKKKGLKWRIEHSVKFQNFNRVLDCVMQEREQLAIGTVRQQAEVISMDFEHKLWENNVLGKEPPDKLNSTVLYLLADWQVMNITG